MIIVFIVDLSGWTDTWKGWLRSWLKVPIGRIKPFDCSLCSTWWVGIIYLICVGKLTITWISAVAVISMLTPVIMNALLLVSDILQVIINNISKLCNKLNN